MAHMLETFGDKAAFVSHREVPWHHLGTVTEDVLTAESALELAHLNGWDVRKTPIFTNVDGQTITVEDKFAVVRNNPFEPEKRDALGVVGKQYEPVQNEEHAEFLNALAEFNEFETAGSINGGREVFVTMKAPDHLLIGGVDPVDTYITAINTHDGSKAFTVVTTPVRTVCKNTMVAALSAATAKVAIRHTRGKGGAVARAREALDVTFKYMDELQIEADRMIDKELTDLRFGNIVSRIYPIDEAKMSKLQIGRARDHRSNVMSLFKDSPTNTEIRGTNWAGYQAFTEYFDHFVNVPGSVGQAEVVARAENVVAGKYDAKKELAYKLLSV
jgi:phage/plasmid-like protein (TIGR03299 family)